MCQRNPYFGKVFEGDTAKAVRRDSNNGEPQSINQDLRTEYASVWRKMPFPECMPQHDHGNCILSVIGGEQNAAHVWSAAQHLKVISCDHACIYPLCSKLAGRDIGWKAVHIGRQAGECLAMVAIFLILGQREIRPPGIPFCITAEDAHQFLRLRYGKGTKQQHVNDTEDRRIGADAQCQRQHCNQRESRVFPKHPRSVAQVLKDVFQHSSHLEYRSVNSKQERRKESILHTSFARRLLSMKKATSTTTLEPAEETTGKKCAHSGGP